MQPPATKAYSTLASSSHSLCSMTPRSGKNHMAIKNRTWKKLNSGGVLKTRHENTKLFHLHVRRQQPLLTNNIKTQMCQKILLFFFNFHCPQSLYRMRVYWLQMALCVKLRELDFYLVQSCHGNAADVWSSLQDHPYIFTRPAAARSAQPGLRPGAPRQAAVLLLLCLLLLLAAQ